MKAKFIVTTILGTFLMSITILAQEGKYESINSGVVWFDQNNNTVSAHGACIVKEGELYYLFGEFKSDTANAFVGFACYSSSDLINWKFENTVLPRQKNGLLGPDRVGERPKVMKCPATGEFIMYMHCDDLKYNDPHVGYATCKTINGNYEFQGSILQDGSYIRKWDLGSFQDSDGKGYLLTHEGFIYELSTDYKSVKRLVVSDVAKGGESPAMFKSNGLYFWLFSNKTSWERNDNYYLTAHSIEGPWIHRGLFAPEGSLTWNSQCSFVLPIITGNDTLNMYMGDRWSFPKQNSAATYVWQPITVKGDEMSIPQFYESWNFDKNGSWFPVNYNFRLIENNVKTQGKWDITDDMFRSNEKGAIITFSFTGEQISMRSKSNNTSGYARVILKNSKDQEVINTVVDFYCKNETPELKFISPLLNPDNYTFSVEVLGEHPFWNDKRVNHYGSTDNYIIITNVLYR